MIEESRTNGIRNNSAQGIVVGTVGTGGAFPTNWENFSAANGIACSILGAGTELGIDYVDIRFQGTANVTSNQRLAFDTQIAAANGQTFAMSAFIRVAGGSLGNVGACFFAHQFRDAGGVSLTTSSGPPFTPTGMLARYGALGTATHVSTAFVEPELNFGVANGQAINVTLRIGWPQQELGLFVTSPIRTTGAAATRAGDVVHARRPVIRSGVLGLCEGDERDQSRRRGQLAETDQSQRRHHQQLRRVFAGKQQRSSG